MHAVFIEFITTPFSHHLDRCYTGWITRVLFAGMLTKFNIIIVNEGFTNRNSFQTCKITCYVPIFIIFVACHNTF